MTTFRHASRHTLRLLLASLLAVGALTACNKRPADQPPTPTTTPEPASPATPAPTPENTPPAGTTPPPASAPPVSGK